MSYEDEIKLKIDIILKSFERYKIKIDKITISPEIRTTYIDESSKFFINFWYQKKLVEYSPKMTLEQINYYLSGLGLPYTYFWKENIEGGINNG